MLGLMAQNGQSFNVGFILLNVGLIGYISDNTYLAYIGFIGSLICFVRAFIEVHLAKRKKREDTVITN
jgi:hypothetical protein